MWQTSPSPSTSQRHDRRHQKSVADSTYASTSMTMHTTKLRNSRRRRSSEPLAAAAVLVASFLVVHAPAGVHAAPSSLDTSASSLSSRALVHASSVRDSGRRGTLLDHSAVDPSRAMTDDVDDDLGYYQARQDDSLRHLSSSPPHHLQQQIASPTRTRDSNDKRALAGYSVNGTSNHFIPAAFTSTLANAWDPGRRSVWFQRKAVIITSIFLAIFIVLIIGATVFLRDKRDDDLDEEYDVSDEAALARMREEREMRLGSRGGEKKSSKFGRLRKKDSSSTSTRSNDNDGTSTAIVASKWGRLPTRKIRMRKKKSRDSSLTEEKTETELTTTTPAPTTDDNGNSQNDHMTPSTGSDSHDTSLARQTSASTPGTEELPPPLTPRETHAALGGDNGGDSLHSVRPGRAVPLDEADVTFAEEEEERMRMSDALPPAYIPAHRRRSVQHDGAAGAAAPGAPLHPSAARQLAGQQGSNAVMEARSDEKRAFVETASGEHGDVSGAAGLSSSAASGAGSSVSTSNGQLDAHIATDDKSMLSRMRLAASQPTDSPSYDQTVSSAASYRPMSSSAHDGGTATAPSLEGEDIGYEHLTGDSSDMQVAHVAKGKNASRPSGSSLPAPPAPHVAVAFSHFDMPYVLNDSVDARRNVPRGQRAPSPSTSHPATSTPTNEKQREAEEEARKSLSVLPSNPDDLPTTLPRYERNEGGGSAAPSAPPHLDYTTDAEAGQALPFEPAVAPSAPSASSTPVAEAHAASAPSLAEDDS